MIETPRLILRPFSPEDAGDVLEYLREPLVNCFACMKLNTLEEAQANAKGKQKEGFFARIQRMAEEQQRQLEQQKRQGTMRNVTKKK